MEREREREREREIERERDREREWPVPNSGCAFVRVYIWKTGLTLFWWFTCCLGVYIDCVLIIFIFFEIHIPMNSCFRCRSVHVLLILRMGRIRWNSSKCGVMYCIGYSVKFSLISICLLVLSLIFFGSLHLYCYFEKKNTLTVHVCKYMYVRLCSPLGAFRAVWNPPEHWSGFNIRKKFLFNSLCGRVFNLIAW